MTEARHNVKVRKSEKFPRTLFITIPLGVESQEYYEDGLRYRQKFAYDSIKVTKGVRLLLDHDYEQEIAHTEDGSLLVQNRGDSLYIEAGLPADVVAGDIIEKLQRGEMGVSPGCIVHRDSLEGDTKTIYDATLLELSLVYDPAFLHNTVGRKLTDKEKARGFVGIPVYNDTVAFGVPPK